MKNSKTTLLFFYLLLFGFFAKADEIFFTFSTEVQSFYLNPPNSANLFGRAELLSKGSYSFTENFGFKLEAAGDYARLNKQDKMTKVVFNPKQFGFYSTLSNFDFHVGGFTVAAEGADLNNIFDVVHGKDFRNPFNSKTFGSLGLHTTMALDPVTVKLFYIPKNTKSLMPDTQSAWYPRTENLPIRNSNGTFYVTDKMSYVYKNESEYEKPFDNNFGGSIKASFSLFDFHLFYFSGANQMPKISTDFNIDVTSFNPLVGTIRPPVEINLNWFRSEHAGVGTTFVTYDWITKIFCKQQTDHLPQKEYLPACTFSIENGFSLGGAAVNYFLQTNRVWRSTAVAQELETLSGFFEKSTALGYLIDMDSKGTVSGAFVYNEKNPSWLASIGYEFRFTDHFRTKLSMNQIFATQDLIGKAYDHTDNASLLLSYDF